MRQAATWLGALAFGFGTVGVAFATTQPTCEEKAAIFKAAGFTKRAIRTSAGTTRRRRRCPGSSSSGKTYVQKK